MKIIIKGTIDKEIEIEFPFYSKNGTLFHYYTKSEKKCIQVEYSEEYHNAGIETFEWIPEHALSLSFETSTKEEFETVFKKALEKLTKTITND